MDHIDDAQTGREMNFFQPALPALHHPHPAIVPPNIRGQIQSSADRDSRPDPANFGR
jgi:hypothetical protein